MRPQFAPGDPKLLAVHSVQSVCFDLLLHDFLFDREAARVVRRLRMVGHAEVFVAAFAGGLGHLLQRVDAVRPFGMCVQDAADVCVGDQFREFAAAATAISPRPSRSSGSMNCKAERFVYFGFRFRGDDLFSTAQAILE